MGGNATTLNLTALGVGGGGGGAGAPSGSLVLVAVVLFTVTGMCACASCILGGRIDTSTPVMSLEGCVEVRAKTVEVNLELADLSFEERSRARR